MPTFSNIRLAGTPIPTPVEAISPKNAEQLSPLAQWGNGTLKQIAWAPDGLRLAIGTSVGVLLYNTANMQELGWLAQGNNVSSMAFSPDSRHLALSFGAAVKVYRVSDGAEIKSLDGICPEYCGDFHQLVYSPDGKILAVLTNFGRIFLWSLLEDRLLFQLSDESVRYDANSLSAMFSEDGLYLGVAFNDGWVRFWQTGTGSLSGNVQIQLGQPYYQSVALSPGLRLVASGMEDGSIHLWQLSQDQAGSFSSLELPSLTGHTQRVRSLFFSAHGEFLLSGSNDHSARVWRLADGVQVAKADGVGLLFSGSFSSDGLMAGFYSFEGLYFWKFLQAGQPQRLEGYNYDVASLAFSPDNLTLAAGYWIGPSVLLWPIASPNSPIKMTGDGQAFAFSPSGETITIAGYLYLDQWKQSNGVWKYNHQRSLIHIRAGGGYTTMGLALTADGTLLAEALLETPPGDGGIDIEADRVQLWKVEDGSLLRSLAGRFNYDSCLAFSQDGSRLAARQADKTIKLWSIPDGAPLFTLNQDEPGFCPLAFSPDGKLLASTKKPGGIQLWKVEDGSPVNLLEEIFSGVRSIAFSPDGRLVAGGLENGTLRLWDISTGFQVRSLEGHTGSITALAYSPDGRILASGSQDGTLRLWGLLP